MYKDKMLRIEEAGYAIANLLSACWIRFPKRGESFITYHLKSPYMYYCCRAFVAPVDIQPFTRESKNKLLNRCKGKTVKYFSQAVKEICDIFEDMENRSTDSLKDDNDGQTLLPDANSTEMVDDGMTTDGPSGEASPNDNVNHGPGLERCSHIRRDMEYEDGNPSISPIVDHHSSLDVSTKKHVELCNDDIISPKRDSISTSGAGTTFWCIIETSILFV